MWYDLQLSELQEGTHRLLMKLGKQYPSQIRINAEFTTSITATNQNRSYGAEEMS